MKKNIDTKHIRNIAIIAHVDHGKTTLVDAFLKQCNLFEDFQEVMDQVQIMDNIELEREKGITIKAKNASVRYKGFKINIIDTPGHSDFSGEVERTLNMADGCLLLVDAQEGPMPQTKFVLKKAFELDLPPIVVINKIDKPFSEPKRVFSEINDLFLELATNESQLDFPTFYAIGRDGKIFSKLPDKDEVKNTPPDISPLLDKIIENIPAPKGNLDSPFRMQATNVVYDEHKGWYLIGRIDRGTVKIGQNVVLVDSKGENVDSNEITDIFTMEGLEADSLDNPPPGEIVGIAGLNKTPIGATLCEPSHIDPLPSIKISQPTVKIKIEPNSSPLLGQEGEFVNYKQLQQRLEAEANKNIALKIEKAEGGYFVSGRGELQLGILIETMRREGYEFQVRKPEIILKVDDGQKKQPLEEVVITTPKEYQSQITKLLLKRKAEIKDIVQYKDSVRITVNMLTARLFGLRSLLVTLSKNQAVMNNAVIDYVPFSKEEVDERNGVILSRTQGNAVGYSLNSIQERGTLFIKPGDKVYEGMIVGLNKYPQDLEVSPTKERQRSAVRMKHDEITQTNLRTPKKITIEFALLFLAKDELLEVTPKNLRLRKVHLTKKERDKHRKGMAA